MRIYKVATDINEVIVHGDKFRVEKSILVIYRKDKEVAVFNKWYYFCVFNDGDSHNEGE